MSLVSLVSATMILFELRSFDLNDDLALGDSYVMFDALHFSRTGVIYRDLSVPPYSAAQYSPFVYFLYAIPGKLFGSSDVFFGPRILALVIFAACLAMLGSLSKVVVPEKRQWLWGPALAVTVTGIWTWPLQLRGDFPGILLSLLTLRLLVSSHRKKVILAGLAAGLALQFKFTFISAGVAGTMWLVARRQWRDTAKFLVAAVCTSIGLYALLSFREPRMVSQMFALSPGVVEIRGWVTLMVTAFSNILVLFALSGAVLMYRRNEDHGLLFLLYSVVAFGVAILTSLQAGANGNYFFEPLFSLVPFAVLGVTALMVKSRWSLELSILVAGLLTVFVTFPMARDLRIEIASFESPKSLNRNINMVAEVLAGSKVFSTVPRVALFDTMPVIIEPYLLSYLTVLGKTDPAPLLARIRSGEFDVVVTHVLPQSWRKIPFVPDQMREAIADGYEAHCTVNNWLFHTALRDSIMKPRLAAIGCLPLGPKGPGKWWGLENSVR